MTDEQAIKELKEDMSLYESDTVKLALQIAIDCLAKEIRYAQSDKEAFNGRCPYTDKECDDFHCWRCEVEEEEEEYARHCFEAKEENKCIEEEDINNLIGEGFEL